MYYLSYEIYYDELMILIIHSPFKEQYSMSIHIRVKYTQYTLNS